MNKIIFFNKFIRFEDFQINWKIVNYLQVFEKIIYGKPRPMCRHPINCLYKNVNFWFWAFNLSTYSKIPIKNVRFKYRNYCNVSNMFPKLSDTILIKWPKLIYFQNLINLIAATTTTTTSEWINWQQH